MLLAPTSHGFGALPIPLPIPPLRRKLFATTKFAQVGPNYHFFSGAILDYRAGKCAFLAGVPGLAKYVTLTGGVKWSNSTHSWAASKDSTRLSMPGSTQVSASHTLRHPVDGVVFPSRRFMLPPM